MSATRILQPQDVNAISTDYAKLTKYSEEGVLLLLSDSTNANVKKFSLSEKKIGESIRKIFADIKGRILISTFASNVYRVQQIVEASVACNRKIIVYGRSMEKTIKVAIAGKYTKLSDAYISVVESLKHAGYANDAKIDIKWINSEECVDETVCKELMKDVDAVVVPGGFGIRGIEGKLNVIKYARLNNVPFLGLCLGMQCAVIEYARNVVGLKNANSAEFNENAEYPVIDLMQEQKNVKGYGGTMRLGAYDCILKEGSVAAKAYGATKISERHRHRYEVNSEYLERIQNAGLVFSGMSPDGMLAEIVELPQNDWFVASQFHPEFKSRPENPHPLFLGLIKAACKRGE